MLRDLRGPNDPLCLACASGNVAIGRAARMIRMGLADRFLAGASDGFHEYTLAFFARAGASAKDRDPEALDTMKPCDVDRAGILLSDGAGYVLLESEAAARERGATIYGEVLGLGQTSDAYTPNGRCSPGQGRLGMHAGRGLDTGKH